DFHSSSSAHHLALHSFPTRRSSDLCLALARTKAWRPATTETPRARNARIHQRNRPCRRAAPRKTCRPGRSTSLTRRCATARSIRSEEHTSELQSLAYLVCRLLLEKK